ncbi:MAG: methylated-DNA--[protein]-cysteine S-methyltransferase [Proteobacteria bacterium]|nr:methylated-DNA--[protein]-cysteine S-methyltransferase [Pseudomonadota bacterium]
MATVVAAIACRAPAGALATDVRATAFQQQVWDALAAIPSGEIRSYGAIGRALGRPQGARAVAAACAANPLAVVVPCHCAVRGSGELAGYRWGTARKMPAAGSRAPR